jgi:hypothetical protein
MWNPLLFTYLGSIINKESGTLQDMQCRIRKAKSVFMQLCILKRTKLKLFKTVAKCVLLYECETGL